MSDDCVLGSAHHPLGAGLRPGVVGFDQHERDGDWGHPNRDTGLGSSPQPPRTSARLVAAIIKGRWMDDFQERTLINQRLPTI